MKKSFSLFLALILVFAFGVFAIGSGESSEKDQGKESVASSEESKDTIGKYSVVIDSCRMAKDFEGKPIIIVKYIYTNVSNDEATSFDIAFDDNLYQDGVELQNSYFVDESANYNSDNQDKKIKKGVSLEVESAYELNDTKTDVVVEIEELFSFDDRKIKKTFSIK